jgi:hypothetical protein
MANLKSRGGLYGYDSGETHIAFCRAGKLLELPIHEIHRVRIYLPGD